MNERERQIYDYVRTHQPVSAAAVAKAIPSIPSVATYISRMKKEGYLSAQGNETITQSNGQVIPRSLYGIGEVVPPQEQEPSAAPTATPPTPQPDNDPVAALIHTQNSANAPQTVTDAPQSTQAPTDAQFTDEDGQTLYGKILKSRKYSQMLLTPLLNIIGDIDEGETELQTLLEVMRHYAYIMLGSEQPDKQHIPDKEVRQYVRTFTSDPDVQTADQYVYNILKNKRHFKFNKQDISNSRWIKELQDKATER